MSPSKKPAKARKTAKKPAAKVAPKAAKAKPKVAAKVAAKPVAKKPPPPKKEAAPKKAPAAGPPGAKPEPKARKKAAASAKAVPASREAKPGLGYKWICFRCSAKFYDLGKPEPVCPRCNTDQRERPASDSPPSPPPVRRPAQPPMARYLDEEEAATDETFVDEGEEEAAELDIEAIEETGAFVEPDYEDE